MENNKAFYEAWDHYMFGIAFASIAAAVLILLYHEMKISKIKDLKERYDYVNLHEVRFFWYAVVALIVAGSFLGNTVATEKIEAAKTSWFYVRLFITFCFGIIAYVIFSNLVKIYYPRVLERRLNRLRNKPRISPDGNVMRKLSESEENHHLDAGQMAEEEVHSVDYDVWLDEKTGYKKIEKYYAYQHAEECSECGYFTMKIDREEVEKAPTQSETGLLIKHFQCSYCNHREQREELIAKLADNV